MGCSGSKIISESEKITVIIKDIPKLSLRGILRQEDLSELCNKKFKKLKELNLSKNDLIDISFLKELNAPKLKKIDLSFNQIKNIIDDKNFSKYYNFPQLEELNLSNNNLIDIYEFKAFKAPNLKILDISFNHFNNINLAQNIEVFKFNFDFPKLEQFNNSFCTEKNIERTGFNKEINNKIIENQINNPIVSSFKLSSKE
jgi:Leucine-rich repeat (LRR) protein